MTTPSTQSSELSNAKQPKVALITGITGQDGSYLAEFLLEKGYIVHGIKRWISSVGSTMRSVKASHPGAPRCC